MRKINHSLLIISFFLTTIAFISLVQLINISYAQGHDETIIVSTSSRMTEMTENIDNQTSVSSISLSLPSESWNITNIQLNISDIKLGEEVKTVEDKGQAIHTIDPRGKLGYGVEINITEPTIIFGVYIYGYITGTPVFPVYVQIQGFDGGTDAPDGNILANTLINISSPEWHLQTFEEEISLTTGSYYLAINGSELFPTDKSTYNWFYNASGSYNINLHTAVYDGEWKQDDIGKPLLYKLIQRVNRSFNPEEVNMTAELNGSSYPILDGPSKGTGNLTINDVITPNATDFNIEIGNNRSIGLIFNLSYQVKLVNHFFSDGQLELRDNSANSWLLTPDFTKIHQNYTVKFNYPTSWYNFSVKRNGVDITPNVTINILDEYLVIPNDVLIDGASWEINANSPNVVLSLKTPKLKFEPDQDLEFSVLPPINPGNLTYVLINSLGFEEYRETVEIAVTTTSEIVLAHTLSSNPNKGIYWAYVYWFDGENAGIKSQDFQVNVPFVLDPLYIVIIVVGSVLLAGASFISYKLVKRSKTKHQEFRQKIYNKYMDVLNLDYFIIIEKNTGLNIYEQLLAGKDIDASLITGFLEAIRNFGIELTGANEQSQTIKLEYLESKIIMSEFKDFRILLIMKDNPSQDFLDSIKSLSYDIDGEYGEDLANFTGEISKFSGIKNLLDIHLETSLIYPLELKTQNVKISSDEKTLIIRAEEVMKMRKTDYFFLSYLLYAKKGFQIKDAETVLNLIDKKIFKPKI
ncbi:MAG: hypothetical protein KGD58_14105 [Candidatus Lokiarchaeota archaeon]|nr:hypothetical protein [Candidatus Lokiarchaeota archaeon]